MIRRLLAAAALVAVPLTAAPAEAVGCPPGTTSRPTGLYSPLTGKPITYCAVIWP